VNYYDANVILGNQLLDDAGFLDSDLDGFREAPDGSDFNVIVEYAIYSDIALDVGASIVDALENLGIDAIGYPHPFNEWLYKLQLHEDFDMIFLGRNFGMDIRDAAIDYHSSNYGVDYYNYPNFVNSEYDYWVDQLLNAWDYDDVQVAAYEVQRIFAEECPIIICYENFVYSASRNPLDGMQVSSMHGGTNYETFTNLMGVYPEFETVTSAVDWPGTLNPFRAEWWYSDFATLQTKFNPMELVYEGLARRDIDGNIVPQLAKSINYDPAGGYIDIVLNKDVMWHNGRSFSPWDIYFTMNYLQDYPVGLFADACSHVVSVAVMGDREVRIRLDQSSYWTVEDILQVPILPEHIWMHVDDPVNYENELAIGTGPFALYDFYGDEVVLQQWPALTHMEVAYSIGHFYPAPAPYWFQPYHVLQKGTTLTIGYGMAAFDLTAELAEEKLRYRIENGLVVLEIDGKALADADSGYLWEYLTVEYDEYSGQFRAYVPYRYYQKALPAETYRIYWMLDDPYIGVLETTGYVTWVKG
jgi:ABC-type transport system substrate-binding protein